MELNINIQKFIKKNIKKYYEKKEKNIKNNQKKLELIRKYKKK